MKLSQMSVMNVEKGEESSVGLYKLLAKKKADGIIEWAHFIQRNNGLKEGVLRGTAKNHEELDTVI